MSYSIHLNIDTGWPEPARVGEDWGYTSNCSEMWCQAGADLGAFDGQLAGKCATVLRSAIRVLESELDRFLAMNPPNGWGSYADLVPHLEKLLAWFETHPLATVRVWR
jgi:hypothetical protein